jgi:hypothetical protein
MTLPRSPLAVFLTLCCLFLPTGAGLTAPVWLMVMGARLDVAADVGSRIVGVTILACVALGAAYMVLLRPRIAAARAAAGPVADHGPEDNTMRDRLVHMVVWVLFVVPFVLIIVGFIVGQLEKLAVD